MLNVAVASWHVFKMQSAPNELAALYEQSTSAWRMISDRFREDHGVPLHTDGCDFGCKLNFSTFGALIR